MKTSGLLFLLLTAMLLLAHLSDNGKIDFRNSEISISDTSVLDKEPGEFDLAHRMIRTLDGKDHPDYKVGDLVNELFVAKKRSNYKRNENYDWIERGPGNVGGRVRSIIVDPSDSTSRTWYLGSTGGGVWCTKDAGESWELLTKEILNLSTSQIAMAMSNKDVIYAGTGDGFGSATQVTGSGIWKTIDKGESWQRLESTVSDEFTDVSRIVVNPNDENEVLVSTVDGFNGLSYIFKSIDGGLTWERKFRSPNGRIQQLIALPDNFDVLYASVNSRGVLRSQDRGETWNYVWQPEGVERRIEMAIAPSNDVIYLSCEAGDESILYITRDSFETVNRAIFNNRQPHWLGSQGWMDNTIAVNPFDKDIVWVGGQGPVIELRIGETIDTVKSYGSFSNLASSIKFIENSFFPFDVVGPSEMLFSGLPVSTEITNEDYNNVELRFGPGISSKAHLLDIEPVSYTSQFIKMVDVPFEAWDTDNNKQIAVSVLDIDRNGEWSFENYDGQFSVFHDIITTNNVDYTELPNNEIVNVNPVYKSQYYLFMGRSSNYTGSSEELPFGFVFINVNEIEGNISDYIPIVDGRSEYTDIKNVGTKGVHVDFHGILMISKDSINEKFDVLIANDGGVAFSQDGGETFSQTGDSNNPNGLFSTLYGFNTSQFYGIDKKNGENRFIGGTQDNGSWVSPLDPDSSSVWKEAPSGDGFESAWNFDNSNLLLETSQYNNLYKSTNEGISFNRVQLPQSNGPFVTRLASSKINPDLVFMVSNIGVLRSEDFADSWSSIDMPDRWEFNGTWGPPISISLADPDYVWTGNRINNGSRICYSTDAGLSFQESNPYLEAETGIITGIATHPNDPNVAYVLSSQKGAPKILKTEDLGMTWTDISGYGPDSQSSGFPDVATYCLLVMPWDEDVLWAGTEIGLFESTDGGLTWEYANNGFPAVSIWQMKIVNSEIIFATFGRGIWTLNTDEFDVSSVSDSQFLHSDFDVYPNPSSGIINLSHSLDISDNIRLELLSINGNRKMVKELKGDHQYTIDLSSLSSGCYLLKLNSERGTLVRKVIIE